VVLILRAAARSAVLWKNGGGVTREVAVHPPGSGFESFDWRVSIAEVRTGGPFSVFPDIDRSMAVLEGTLSLMIAGRDPLTLSPDTPPVHFRGEAQVAAEPLGGAVTDLNVMTRRDRCRSRMSRTAVHGPARVAVGEAAALILALTPLGLESGTGRSELARLDAALLEGPGSWEVRPASGQAGGGLWLIELMAR
jgi:uncharacterized protein